MNFEDLILDIRRKFFGAPLIDNAKWQSVKAPQKTYEILNYSFTAEIDRSLEDVKMQIKPNLPWADRHFENERVSGMPLNPGKEWRIWPYAASADTHRHPGEEDPQFSHSYAERFWPKHAGLHRGGVLAEFDRFIDGHRGIRFPYGDLNDLVTTLGREPTTRQAYLPVWFPEDLRASVMEKRVPCTLGYHFIMRDQQLHVVYPMRSCDFIRHFRDDVYLTIRLLFWVLDQCRKRFSTFGWEAVQPGTLTMHITSLHIFESDYKRLVKGLEHKAA